MSHKRNVSGLLANAKKRSKEAEERAEKAIRSLIKLGRPINFNTVSQTAGVSIPWCYSQPNIRRRIETLREQFRNVKGVPVPLNEKPSEASKDAIIVSLKRRVSELTQEVSDLRKQLEVAYGKLDARENGRIQ